MKIRELEITFIYQGIKIYVYVISNWLFYILDSCLSIARKVFEFSFSHIVQAANFNLSDGIQVSHVIQVDNYGV